MAVEQLANSVVVFNLQFYTVQETVEDVFVHQRLRLRRLVTFGFLGAGYKCSYLRTRSKCHL